MARFIDKVDDNDVICPYCGHRYQCGPENYCVGGRDEECDNCGKKYHMRSDIIINQHTSPDCELNGGYHDLVGYRIYTCKRNGFSKS